MRKIYVCHTLYHLYISIIESLNDDSKNDLILCNQINNSIEIRKSLIKYNIFQEVFLVNDLEIEKKVLGKKKEKIINLIFLKKKIVKEYSSKLDFLNEKNYQIIIFNDAKIIFQYIYQIKKDFILIEDGLRIYQNLNLKLVRKILFKVFKMPMIFQDGRYSEIKKIKVIDPEKILDKRYVKSEKLNLNIKSSVNKEYLNKILIEIFNFKSNEFKYTNNKKVILFTQPLSEDRLISEDEKNTLYDNLLNELSVNFDEIYIKKHPRDTSDYSNKYNYVNQNMPSEILNILPKDYFDLAIACYSTAIGNILVAKKKKNLFKSIPEIIDFINER